MEKLDIKHLLYYRYADDIDLFLRSIGRKTKFCPVDGKMVEKTEEEIEADMDKHDDEVTMIELKKIADTIQANITTEADFPSKHPELGNKVPVLDLVLWVEDVKMYSPRMDCEKLHLCCDLVTLCLPIGQEKNLSQNAFEDQSQSSPRMVPQIQF